MNKKLEEIPVSKKLDQVVEQSMAQLREEKKKNMKKVWKNAGCGVAAAAALGVIVCVGNPAVAGKLPLIGDIFQKTQDEVEYKGDFSSQDQKQTLISKEEAIAMEENTEEAVSNPYVQTSNGITVAVTESYCSSHALYLSVSVASEEGFPEDFNRTENREDYTLDYDVLNLYADGTAEGVDANLIPNHIEGHFEDANTFVGMMMVDFSDLEETVPDSFTYHLSLKEIYSDLLETEEVTITNEDGSTETVQDPIMKSYEGSWNFQIAVEKDVNQTQTVEVAGDNGQGAGIASVSKTPFELSAEVTIPEGEAIYDYILVMCDAQGDLLDSQGSSAELYSTYGRDTSSVYVYVCDYNEYMDELKSYYWSEDYETNRETKNFAQYLDEHAVYGTQITFE